MSTDTSYRDHRVDIEPERFDPIAGNLASMRRLAFNEQGILRHCPEFDG